MIAVVSQLHPFDLANANEPVHIAFISAVAGWIFMYPLSHAVLFYSRISRALQYVGKHTLSILCLHMIGFKVVSLMNLRVRELPIIYLSCFLPYDHRCKPAVEALICSLRGSASPCPERGLVLVCRPYIQAGGKAEGIMGRRRARYAEKG